MKLQVPPAAARILAGPALRALAASWRIRTIDEERWRPLYDARRPHVFLLWHEALLPLLWHHRRQSIAIVVSEARDGQYLADFAASLGYRAVRGSSTRGGARALLGAVRELEAGYAVAFTPDGPRGPRRELKPGVVAAAQRGRSIVVPLHARGGPRVAVTFVGSVHDSQAGAPSFASAMAGRSRSPRARRGWRRACATRRRDCAKSWRTADEPARRHPSGHALAVDQPPAGCAARAPGAVARAPGSGGSPWIPGAWRIGAAGSRCTICRCLRSAVGNLTVGGLGEDADRHLDRAALRRARAQAGHTAPGLRRRRDARASSRGARGSGRRRRRPRRRRPAGAGRRGPGARAGRRVPAARRASRSQPARDERRNDAGRALAAAGRTVAGGLVRARPRRRRHRHPQARHARGRRELAASSRSGSMVRSRWPTSASARSKAS